VTAPTAGVPAPVPAAGASAPEPWREVAELLRQATGEDDAFLAGIGPDTRLDGDLLVDSLELAALDVLLRQRYGDGVDLVGYVAGLDIDEIVALTVADVAGHVARHR
jgi:hypothetical protein